MVACASGDLTAPEPADQTATVNRQAATPRFLPQPYAQDETRERAGHAPQAAPLGTARTSPGAGRTTPEPQPEPDPAPEPPPDEGEVGAAEEEEEPEREPVYGCSVPSGYIQHDCLPPGPFSPPAPNLTVGAPTAAASLFDQRCTEREFCAQSFVSGPGAARGASAETSGNAPDPPSDR